MDPDAALAELRELANGDLAEFGDEVHRIAELFIGLDDWIKRGGVLPKDWRNNSAHDGMIGDRLGGHVGRVGYQGEFGAPGF